MQGSCWSITQTSHRARAAADRSRNPASPHCPIVVCAPPAQPRWPNPPARRHTLSPRRNGGHVHDADVRPSCVRGARTGRSSPVARPIRNAHGQQLWRGRSDQRHSEAAVIDKDSVIRTAPARERYAKCGARGRCPAWQAAVSPTQSPIGPGLRCLFRQNADRRRKRSRAIHGRRLCASPRGSPADLARDRPCGSILRMPCHGDGWTQSA